MNLKTKTMKKTFYLAIVLGTIFVFSGCSLTQKASDAAAKKAAEKILGAETNSNVSITNNSVTINTNEGSMSSGENIPLPTDFPNDIPIYAGAKITASYSTKANSSFTLTLTSSDAIAAIKTYYDAELVKDGWTIDDSGTWNMGAEWTNYSASKDNRTLTVTLIESAEDTNSQKAVAISITTQTNADTNTEE